MVATPTDAINSFREERGSRMPTPKHSCRAAGGIFRGCLRARRIAFGLFATSEDRAVHDDNDPDRAGGSVMGPRVAARVTTRNFHVT